jgi:DNA-directed RNA polymerase subunit beta
LEAGVPESFKILVKELQSLCLQVTVETREGVVVELKDEEETTPQER